MFAPMARILAPFRAWIGSTLYRGRGSTKGALRARTTCNGRGVDEASLKVWADEEDMLCTHHSSNPQVLCQELDPATVMRTGALQRKALHTVFVITVRQGKIDAGRHPFHPRARGFGNFSEDWNV